MMLCGGHGKSPILNCSVAQFGSPRPEYEGLYRGPAMVDNSPGAKESIVLKILRVPQRSPAAILKKLA